MKRTARAAGTAGVVDGIRPAQELDRGSGRRAVTEKWDTFMGHLSNPRPAVRRTSAQALATLLMVAGALAIAAPDASRPSRPDVLVGFTAPARLVTLAAVQPGRLADVAVTEGQQVPAGTLLFRMDDDVQQRRVAVAQAAAASTVESELAQLELREAQRELDRIKTLGPDSATSKERGDAAARVDQAALLVAQAEFKHSQAQRELAYQQALLDNLHFRAPFDGYVAAVARQAGDTLEEQAAVITLAQLDTLEVEVDCPLHTAVGLAADATVTVRPADGLATARPGRVTFVSRVADPASQTVKLKISVPNPDGAWLAGMRVNVTCAPPAAAQPPQPSLPLAGAQNPPGAAAPRSSP